MSVVIPFASPGCICAIASSTPPPASSGPLVHLPPRAHTLTPETVLKIDSLSRDSAYFEVINVRSTTDTCESARLLAA